MQKPCKHGLMGGPSTWNAAVKGIKLVNGLNNKLNSFKTKHHPIEYLGLENTLKLEKMIENNPNALKKTQSYDPPGVRAGLEDKNSL